MAYTLLFVADMGPARTGMAVYAQLYDADGTPNGAEITSGVVEVDSTNAPGVYSYSHAAIPDAHRGTFAMYNSADQTQRVAFAINPEEAERVDVASSSLATAAALATVDGIVDSILTDTNELQTDDVPGLIAALNDPDAAAIADAVWDETLADHDDAGSTGAKLADVCTLGAGATAKTYTVNDGDGNPIDGVSVWVTTDEAGSNIVASGTTDDSGEVTFYLDSGTTYYLFRQHASYNFSNPDTEIA